MVSLLESELEMAVIGQVELGIQECREARSMSAKKNDR
jgi:hypothetical protein